MANRLRSKSTNAVFWVILGLLFLGLGGFGVRNFGGSIRSIGSVGAIDISVTDYANALRQEIRAIERQTGKPMSMAQAKAIGLDQAVRQRIISRAALDNENKRIGLSVGDGRVRQEVSKISAFQGVSGKFDRQAYIYALKNAGLKPAGFEKNIRRDAARRALRDAVVAGATAPKAYSDTVLAYLAQRRSFIWAPVPRSMLLTGIPVPSAAELQKFYKANAKVFTRPEIRKITYAWLTPQMLAKKIPVDEKALRALYVARKAKYQKPERRRVEQLAYANAAAATAARADIDAGKTTFAAQVKARGLSLSDVDMGEVARGDLGTAAAAAVFALDKPGVAGPVKTNLGPTLFRVTAITKGHNTSFKQARPELLAAVTADKANQMIADKSTHFDELLAGGATLEDLAKETDMQLASIDFSSASKGGIANFPAFRKAANAVGAGDYPSITPLADGGVFALRLDKIVPPTLPPLAKIRAKVEARWTAQETRRQMLKLAKGLQARIEAGATFASLSLAPRQEKLVLRRAFVPGAPQALIQTAFKLDKGATAVVAAANGVYLVKLTDILPPDPKSPATSALRQQIGAQVMRGLANDLFNYFGNSVLAGVQVRINQAAVNAVQSQFR